MKRIHYRRQALLTWFAVALLVLLQVELLPRFSVTQSAPTANVDTTAEAQYAALPLAFEPNQGQVVDDGVSYLVHHGQATTYFSGTDTVTSLGDAAITMSLDGANTPSYEGTNPLESKTNYFIGNDASQWHSDVPNYKKILAKNVYPGIDLTYYGTNSTLEHDFIVSPNVDYKQIAFHFDGQENLSLDKDGNIVLKTGKDEIQLNAPTTYQQTPNSKHTIPSHFELNDNTITVALNTDYDHSLPLVIDPTLSYSTYLGGGGNDYIEGIVVDASGSVYVAGATSSTDFPTASPYQASNGGGGNNDAFVTKFNPSGSALVYSTYLGGSVNDIGEGVAVDSSGNAYITGYTDSTNFPTSSPYQGSNAGGNDVFVAKLNSAGSALTYSTYLGDTGDDSGYDVAVDSSGSAYVTGSTNSGIFPTASPFQAGNGGFFSYDAFVTKFNPAGSSLVYSTYLGGSATDYGYDIAIDSSGNAYVTGGTASASLPTASAFQIANGGIYDAYLTKLNAAGSALVYSTYLGGSGNDIGYGIAVDVNDNAYVTGFTTSTNFPAAFSFQGSNSGGGGDAFVTKFNAVGNTLAYSTYLGGSLDDYGRGIAVDVDGNAYVTGYTHSTNFPTASPFQASLNGGGSWDVFLTKLNPAGSSLVYSTYLGGGGSDLGLGIGLDFSSNAFVAGYTSSTNFPTASPFQASIGAGGGYDGFIVKYNQFIEHPIDLSARVDPTLTFTIGSTTCALGTLSVSQAQQCTYVMTAATNGESGFAISYLPITTLTSGANTITALSAQTASSLNTEQFGINLRANTAAGSFTATDFGADVSGGSGVVASAYNTANSFKLVVAGDTIASAPSPSLTSTYTVSTLANITNTTEAGAYTTTQTYNIVAGY